MPINEKTNEIPVSQEIISMKDLKYKVVTCVVLNTQKEFACKIIDSNGDYCLALKDNHSNFLDDVIAYFNDDEVIKKLQSNDDTYYETLDKSHSMIERRYYIVSFENDIKLLEKCIRGHWGVENNLHWELDYSFNDDRNTTADKESARALSLMKIFALSLLKIVKECFGKNMSIRRVRNRIGRRNDGLELLFKYLSLAYYMDEDK